MCQYDVRFSYQRDTKTGSSNGYFFMSLLDRTVVESRQESIGWREGAGLAKDLETGIELESP